MKTIIVSTFLFILIFVSLCSATTYYVRTDGHDTASGVNNNDNATTGAWLTIQKAADTMVAGDTAQIAVGEYAGFATAASGSSESGYITFMRQGTDTVTIAGAYPTGQIRVEHDYIKIDGFTTTMSDSYEGGATLRVGNSSKRNHITVENCRFIGNGADTYLILLNADDVLFNNNTVEGDTTFYIGLVQKGSRHTISNNVFKNIVDVERIFNVACSDSTWSGNEIYGLSWTESPTAHPDIWQTINDGSIAQNNIIERNYIHDTGTAQVGNIETNDAGTNVANWTFRNNIFANSGTLYLLGGNFKFYNNTYYRTGASGQAAIYLYDTANGNASGAEFYNNIFLQETDQGYFAIASGSPTYTHDYNFVANVDYSERAGFSETNGINGGNPQFVALYTDCTANTCNFNIGSTSVAKDEGCST